MSFLASFFDGFGLGNVLGGGRRPGAPIQVFADDSVPFVDPKYGTISFLARLQLARFNRNRERLNKVNPDKTAPGRASTV